MTYRRKRSDTLVRTLEQRYGIELHARGDMKLGNLLRKRGFRSWTQFLNAYHGRLTTHARRRRVFLSFHAEDLRQVQGFRLMMSNPNVDLSAFDQSLTAAIQSERGAYIRSRIRPLIQRAEVLLCLIGNGTSWREWGDWEIRTAKELRKGVCGVRLKGSGGPAPEALRDHHGQVAQWNVSAIVAVIEQAAARRS